jgi:hypothetical protein
MCGRGEHHKWKGVEMSGVDIALSIPLIALSLALSVVPVWFAAKVVGTGRQEFGRVALALLLATCLSVLLLKLSVGWGLLLMPAVFVALFGRILETSYLRAFILCLLALAFQAVVSNILG